MSVNQATVRSNLLTSELKTRIAQLQSEVTDLDSQIATQTKNSIDSGNDPDKNLNIISWKSVKNNKLRQIGELQDQLNENSLNNSQTANIATIAAAKSVKSSSVTTDATAQKLTTASSSLEYNVPSVLDAYYSTRASFLNAAGFSSNRPGSVASANELWSNSKSSKGMIVAYTPPPTGIEYQGNQNPPNSVATSGTKYGFQFMYNPGTISMDYSGLPNVDQGFEISGQDKFVLYGTNITQSTIGFQLLINRMFDMKYYDSNGKLKPGAQKAYAGKTPSLNAQKQIFNMGTMYDVEYLLRTLLGYTLKSFLRNNKTADMGYLGARPVELHLGKSLRYLGTVTSLRIEHVIFNEQMVPLFTNVSIGFARLPDYPLASPSVEAPTPSEGGATLPPDERGGLWDGGNMGIGGGGGLGINPYTN